MIRKADLSLFLLITCISIYTVSVGQTGMLKPPVNVLCENLPKPRVIKVPSSSGLGSYTMKTRSGEKKVFLLPPHSVPGTVPFATFTNFNTEQGLALSSIGCSMMDKNGNIWFGTTGGGVSCYDGKSFINFTKENGLGNNTILCIAQDRNGNIWFGTYGAGVSCYDGKSFTSYTTNQGLAGNTVFGIKEDRNGSLWFGAEEGGLSRYDGKAFTNFSSKQGLALDNISCIEEDKNGIIWIGTYENGVFSYDGKTFINYTTTQGLANNSVSSIIEDKKGNLWLGTDKGISRYDGKSFTNFFTQHGFPSGNVRCIKEDKSGNLWFGTDAGVTRYDPSASLEMKGTSFTNFNTEQGLAHNKVMCITEDKKGNLWFGTYGSGVSRYEGNAFTSYTTKQGLPYNTVMKIMEDRTGNIWFGTSAGGVACYDGKSFTTYTIAQGLIDNNIRCLYQDKGGNIWIGTAGGGASFYDGHSFTSYTKEQGLPNNSVKCILVDKKGLVWFSTYGTGISRFDGKSFTNYTTEQGLSSNIVTTMTEDKKGNIWMGTDGGGVSCFNGESFTNYSVKEGLGETKIMSSKTDKSGNLWFGTAGGGLSRYDGKSFLNFSVQHGLPDTEVYDMVEDENGVVWIGTNLGFTELKFIPPFSVLGGKQGDHPKAVGPGLLTVSNQELKNYKLVLNMYNNKTGYPIKDLNSRAMCITTVGLPNGDKSDVGVIWGGCGDDKTIRFDPGALNNSNQAPRVFIQSVYINEENICWYNLDKNENDSITKMQQEVFTYGNLLSAPVRDSIRKKFSDIEFTGITPFYPLPENLVLPQNNNSVTFNFIAIETGRNFLVRYQYILEGYDKEWSPITEKTSATFGNIYEGNYTFKLKARSPEGVWSEPIEYQFKVLAPWWRSGWMYTLYVLAFVSGIWNFIKWRERKLNQEKEILERKVDQRTEELQKANVEIALSKEQIEEKHKEVTDSINYAKRIQNAMLKEAVHISEHMPEHFILFMPKDIVSGDFYWALEKQGHWYLAAVDCTGHGVPGAMMSMLGMSFMNDITSGAKLQTPAEILNQLREKVVKELRQTGKQNDSHDGMDISLMRLNLESRELQWAGANNSINIIQEGKLVEIKGNKQPIGYHPEQKLFTNHELTLSPGQSIYIFSDGYADQFGGSKGKKFKYKQLEDLVLANHHLPLAEQKSILKKTFIDWKGALEQIDDVCVIGVRL